MRRAYRGIDGTPHAIWLIPCWTKAFCVLVAVYHQGCFLVRLT